MSLLYLHSINAPAGRLGPSRHPDHIDDPQQRDNSEPSHLSDPPFRSQMVPQHPEGTGERPRVVHVPDQHGSHDPQVRISRGCG